MTGNFLNDVYKNIKRHSKQFERATFFSALRNDRCYKSKASVTILSLRRVSIQTSRSTHERV